MHLTPTSAVLVLGAVSSRMMPDQCAACGAVLLPVDGTCAIEVPYRMFERWRQENFFKYMREEFLLDALVDYQIEPEDPTRTIPNPERRALDKEIQAARADLARLERETGLLRRPVPSSGARPCAVCQEV
jgi:transposase-like protein